MGVVQRISRWSVTRKIWRCSFGQGVSSTKNLEVVLSHGGSHAEAMLTVSQCFRLLISVLCVIRVESFPHPQQYSNGPVDTSCYQQQPVFSQQYGVTADGKSCYHCKPGEDHGPVFHTNCNGRREYQAYMCCQTNSLSGIFNNPSQKGSVGLAADNYDSIGPAKVDIPEIGSFSLDHQKEKYN